MRACRAWDVIARARSAACPSDGIELSLATGLATAIMRPQLTGLLEVNPNSRSLIAADRIVQHFD
jgi:hypothetical protein